MGINLQEIANGALQEKADQAFSQVMKNMQDPNTPWKNKRKITFCLTFCQNEDRTDCTCDISVEAKLAPVKPVSTKFCTETDLETGEVFAQEYGPGIRGQMTFTDVENLAENRESVNMAEVAGQVVDRETGEVKESHVVDFRTAKRA